jgi:hypothetical protein
MGIKVELGPHNFLHSNQVVHRRLSEASLLIN